MEEHSQLCSVRPGLHWLGQVHVAEHSILMTSHGIACYFLYW
jgi:hypothetical protein